VSLRHVKHSMGMAKLGTSQEAGDSQVAALGSASCFDICALRQLRAAFAGRLKEALLMILRQSLVHCCIADDNVVKH
jgi:hypothetical protein